MFNSPGNSRRNFVKNASVGVLASLSIPQIVSAAFIANKPSKIELAKNDIILFQGDSITDWGRNKTEMQPNNSQALGNGYVFPTATELLSRHADKGLQIYNKGISGNKVYQLADRWDADCLTLKPTILSILVGVNDYWHAHNHSYNGTIDTYRDDFKKLLDRTKQALPDVKLIIGEPFAVQGVKAVDASWYPAFNAFRLAAREIADTYHAVFIPYQTVFDEAIKAAPGNYWTIDGVHPSVAGAGLMAHAWLETVK